jgi:hypothetical protein
LKIAKVAQLEYFYFILPFDVLDANIEIIYSVLRPGAWNRSAQFLFEQIQNRIGTPTGSPCWKVQFVLLMLYY